MQVLVCRCYFGLRLWGGLHREEIASPAHLGKFIDRPGALLLRVLIMRGAQRRSSSE